MGITISHFNIRDLRKNLGRSLYLLWQTSRPLALISFALHTLQALLPVLSLYLIKILIDKVTAGLPFSAVIPTIVYFLAAQLLLALAQQYATYITTVFQLKLNDYLAQQVLDKAVSVSYAYYENPAYHDSLHLAQQQSLYRAGNILSSYNTFITSAFSLVFLLLLFVSMGSLFALLFITFSVPLALIKWYYGIATMQQERKLAPQDREANYLHQILTGVSFAKETRVFGFGSFFIDKFTAIRNYILTEKQSLHKKLTRYGLIAEAAEVMAMAVIFALLAKQALAQTISLGLFVIYIQGFQSLQNNSKNFFQSVVQILQQRIFLQDLFAFLDIDIPHKKTWPALPEIKTGLEVSNLYFQYPQTTKPVLQDISLQCQPGQIIAIVGENGSGKSSLIKLLAKLYEADSGSIRFNGNDINDITDKSYRAQTVFLFQDFEKYFFTIEENIVLGQPIADKPHQAIQQAAQASGADGFISRLSKGYKTRMGRIFEGSEQLSGGEWQKLALARVFYREEASLIVLDEPTSALDAQAEYEIFKQIQSRARGKMVILITHRLYNLKIADYMYVMQQGKIAEEGTFNELIEKGGVFTRLYKMQQL